MLETRPRMECGSATSSTSARPPIPRHAPPARPSSARQNDAGAGGPAMWAPISRPMPRLARPPRRSFPRAEKVFTIFDYNGEWYNRLDINLEMPTHPKGVRARYSA